MTVNVPLEADILPQLSRIVGNAIANSRRTIRLSVGAAATFKRREQALERALAAIDAARVG